MVDANESEGHCLDAAQQTLRLCSPAILYILVTVPFYLFDIIIGAFKLREVHAVSQQAPNATKSTAKLAALLALVGHKLQCAPKLLVVVCQPLEHGLLILHMPVCNFRGGKVGWYPPQEIPGTNIRCELCGTFQERGETTSEMEHENMWHTLSSSLYHIHPVIFKLAPLAC